MIDSNKVFEKLSKKFGDKILTTALSHGEPLAVVDKGAIRDVLAFLKEEAELSYDMLVELFARGLDGRDSPL